MNQPARPHKTCPTRPCKTCPWRRGSNPNQIPGLDIERARGLRNTVGDGTDDFRTIMACHNSTEGDDTPCIGYVATVGYTNLNVRIGAINGTIDLIGIQTDTDTDELYETYDQMLDNIETNIDPT